MKRSFNELHRIERPREKLARGGTNALEDEELLAILLRTGYKGKDVLALARELAKKFPGKKLFELSFTELAAIKGVGETRAATLLAAWELAGRHRDGAGRLPPITTPMDVCAQLAEIRTKRKEHFFALYLNTRNQLLHRECVSIGTLNSSLVHPREVFEPALRHSAASVILAHNHPSGDPAPSAEDTALTRRLVEAGRLLGIEVLDHVIVTAERHCSLRERGDMGGDRR